MVPAVFHASILCGRVLDMVPAANGIRPRFWGHGTPFPDFAGFMACTGFRPGRHTGTALFSGAPPSCPKAGRTCQTDFAPELPFKPGIPRENMDVIPVFLALDASGGWGRPFSAGKLPDAGFILGLPCPAAVVSNPGILLAPPAAGNPGLLCRRISLWHHPAGRKHDPGIFRQNRRSYPSGKIPSCPHALEPDGIKAYFYKIKDGERHRNPIPFPILSTFTGVGFA